MSPHPVVFLNRFPSAGDRRDGYYQRVDAIDRILQEVPRIYLRTDGPATQLSPLWSDVGPNVRELRISRRNPLHRRMASNLVKSGVAYAHSVRALEGLSGELYSLAAARLIDLHGAVPEEAAMLGEEDKVAVFEAIERETLPKADAAIGVTEALLKHVAGKVPAFRGDTVLLPILPPADELGRGAQARDPKGVLYVGGFQEWQSWEAMIDFVQANPDANFTFLTPDPGRVHRHFAARGAEFPGTADSVPPEELPSWLANGQYGLLLRTDSIVNRVACPTKLAEYLQHGLVPIVNTDQIGDFPALGWQTVHHLRPLPSASEAEEMVQENLRVLARLREMEAEGRTRLRDLVTRLRRL